jgi:lipid A 4'-phosphatase
MDVSETRVDRPPTLLMGWGLAPSLYVLLAALIGAAFIRWSSVDLRVTARFWTEQEGFFLSDSWWAVVAYEAVPLVTLTLGVLVAGLLLHNLVRREPLGLFTTRVTLFLLAGLALGPGLVVNWLFKGHWGRPRPRDVVDFGGSMDFMPALVPGGACERNCSFVAGHPSSVFWLAAFGFLLAGTRRYAVFGVAGMAGFIVGWGRVVQGAHFLSDVVFSFLFTFATIYVLARWVFRIPPKYGRVTLGAAALLLAGVTPAPASAQGPSRDQVPLADHVIMVSVVGFQPDGTVPVELPR